MKSLAIVLATGMALSHVAPTQAALISWIAGPTTTASVNDISLNGTLVEAGFWRSSFTVGQSVAVTSGPEVINFVARPGNNTNIGVTFSSGGVFGEPGQAPVFAAPGGFDANFDTVLSGFTNTADPLTVNVLGLTIGRQYQIQMFSSDDRTCCTGRLMYLSDNVTPLTGNMTSNFLESDSPFVIGTFTASATSQSIFAHGVNNFPVVNAYVLRDITPSAVVVPEPATMSLLALSGAAALRRRRRA